MPTPTYMHHKFTGMRYRYVEGSPMLNNPQVSVLDENLKPYEAPKRTIRITRKKESSE